MVRTEVGAIQGDALSGQEIDQPLGYGLVVLHSIEATGDPGLVRDHHQSESGVTEEGEGLQSPRQQGDALRVRKVSHFFDDGAVPIQEDGRPKGRAGR
jgi:hypothetical protein